MPVSKKYDSLIDSLDGAWAAYMDPAQETVDQREWQKAFFDALRSEFGSIPEVAVEGIKTIIFCHRTFWSDSPISYLAFLLGNIRREVGANMQPIKETQRPGETNLSDAQVVARLNAWWFSGKAQKAKVRKKYWLENDRHPFGRGYIQTTWHEKYVQTREVVKEVTGVDIPFDEDYNLMLDPLASCIGAFAMCLRGKYTGKALVDFLRPGGDLDYHNARRVVNGDTHNYAKIAKDCKAFNRALLSAEHAAPGWLANVPPEPIAEIPDLPKIQPDQASGEITVLADHGDIEGWLGQLADVAKQKEVPLAIQVNINVSVPPNFPQPAETVGNNRRT